MNDYEKYWNGERPDEIELKRTLWREAAKELAWLVTLAATGLAAAFLWHAATGGAW